ncbi:hypothetical protein [Salinibacter ruber]|uniref:baeRF7 domain-containing protein n=1 Tax=Salinibacter ruber TaxID=146919 RepID=UPI0021686B42|nr:hypothetical protein [Salinibacter ruber]MCS3611035.1 hypothetical protein [Salinibacter ruber]
MDLFNRDELKRLAQSDDGLCISIYMPTHRFRSDWSQNTTRFKNLLRDVRDQLREQEYRESDIDDILGEARQLLDRPGFWRGLSEGLAAFLTTDTSEFYRLPLPFDEVAIVEDRFHLKPLFPLIASNNRYYLLALSQNDVRLYQGTHQAISEVEAAEIPSDIVTAIQQYEEPPEQGLQSHAQAAPSSPDGGEAGQVRHGHGSSEDQSREPKDELKRFFRRIDESVTDFIGGEEAPLVLAGVSEYLPLYKSVNNFPHLVDDNIIAGNPEQLELKELHREAWSVVESVLQTVQQQELDRFEDLYHENAELASGDFHEIVPACAYGRVDTLFVPQGQYRWGRFDPDSNTVRVHDSQEPGDGDLLNYAALKSYLSGAAVHVLSPEEMPGGRSVAAIFRYEADVTATETD